MEYIPLMEMDGDQSLKLASFYLSQVLSRDIDQHVQHFKKDLVSVVHDLLVGATVIESYFSISCP